MSTIEAEDYMVCEECYLLEGTGDPSFLDFSYNEPEATERWEEILAGFRAISDGRPGHFSCAGDEEQGEEFSWRSCECCGSHLGGSRHLLQWVTVPEGK